MVNRKSYASPLFSLSCPKQWEFEGHWFMRLDAMFWAKTPSLILKKLMDPRLRSDMCIDWGTTPSSVTWSRLWDPDIPFVQKLICLRIDTFFGESATGVALIFCRDEPKIKKFRIWNLSRMISVSSPFGKID